MANVARSTPAPAPSSPTSVGEGSPLIALFSLGLLALSHRLSRQDVLNHPTRARLLEALIRRPGASALDLSSSNGCSYASTRYHLEMLERAALVVRQDSTRPVRYFAVGALTEDDRLAIAVLRSESTARVMALIARKPGITKADLERATGLGGPTIAWHFNRLNAAGLIEGKTVGRRILITPAAERLGAIMKALQEEFPAPMNDESVPTTTSLRLLRSSNGSDARNSKPLHRPTPLAPRIADDRENGRETRVSTR